MNLLAVLFGLALVNRAIISYLASPVRKKYPDLDLWWLVYVSFVTGAFLSAVNGLNFFSEYLDHQMVGLILTALAVGGGSNVLQDMVKAFSGAKSGPAVYNFYDNPNQPLKDLDDAV